MSNRSWIWVVILGVVFTILMVSIARASSREKRQRAGRHEYRRRGWEPISKPQSVSAAPPTQAPRAPQRRPTAGTRQAGEPDDTSITSALNLTQQNMMLAATGGGNETNGNNEPAASRTDAPTGSAPSHSSPPPPPDPAPYSPPPSSGGYSPDTSSGGSPPSDPPSSPSSW